MKEIMLIMVLFLGFATLKDTGTILATQKDHRWFGIDEEIGQRTRRPFATGSPINPAPSELNCYPFFPLVIVNSDEHVGTKISR